VEEFDLRHLQSVPCAAIRAPAEQVRRGTKRCDKLETAIMTALRREHSCPSPRQHHADADSGNATKAQSPSPLFSLKEPYPQKRPEIEGGSRLREGNYSPRLFDADAGWWGCEHAA
jgi:hypothetical protein